MDKTVIIYLIGFGIGVFVGNLEIPEDASELETHKKIIIASTEIWLIIHYALALVTLPVLGIAYLKKRIKTKAFLPFSFNAGFLTASILSGLIAILTRILT